jgi:uncharacterized membrane protein YeaQ/YmgE (transglycosylase-associated protein family)
LHSLLEQQGFVVFLLVAALLCGIIAASIATRKGRSGLGFFLLGVLTGVIGVTVAAIVRGDVPPPKGWKTTTCPRCNARQNVQPGQEEFECWQCNTSVAIQWT